MKHHPNFHVMDDRSADWLLRALANNEAEKLRIQERAAEIVRQLDAETARLKELHLAELEAYCRARLAADGNGRRSLNLLQGTLAFRYEASSLRISNSAAALEWAKENAPDLVIVTEKLDEEALEVIATKIKDEVGELVPGVEVTEARDAFHVFLGRVE